MQPENKEISLKDLILKTRKGITYLKTKWVIILVVGFAGGVIGFFYGYLSKPKYTAELTFVLSSNNKTNSIASLAGQFGFDLGNSNDDLFSGDNIIELFNSRRILEGALFRKIPDSAKTLINLIIEQTKMEEGWKKNKRLSPVIPFPDNIHQLSPLQDSLITALHEYIVKNYLLVDKPDKKLSIYSVSVTSPSEDISYFLTKYILSEASSFYIGIKTKLAKQNLDMLQHEADSLRNLLGNTITSTASASDNIYNLNPAYQVQRSPAQQGQLKVTILATAYGEVVKNLEIAKITLQKETPLYQVIDEPYLPLVKVKKSKLLCGIIGSMLLGFICIVFLLAKKLYKQIVA